MERVTAELRPDQGALLPGPGEAEGKLQIFELSPRLTSHVRHKAKYFDLDLIPDLGFVFTENGKPLGPAVRTLKAFVIALNTYPVPALEGHVHRGDFSRWIADRISRSDSCDGYSQGGAALPPRTRPRSLWFDRNSH